MAGPGGSEQPQRAAAAAAAAPLLAPAAPAAPPVPSAPQAPDGDLDLPGDPSAAEVHLTSRPESASTARRLSLSVVRRWGLSPLGDTVELLVSELVGNAVRHTGAQTFGLRMLRRRGWIRVEVRDPSRALPCLLPVRAMDTSGRGLFLVDHLSDRWGVDLLPRGKTTWFELRVPER
ncbi:ATP-binding protein [Streptomyces sp. V4-01]|uniref:ATP-binding protein n=1 Tax=Actinacidiphila polyblastidii TaxID=3110430 RepID=A0ABU7P4Q1_9ACTN|nr:ATP-binding protein [Streptomyces sp. V4-01]